MRSKGTVSAVPILRGTRLRLAFTGLGVSATH